MALHFMLDAASVTLQPENLAHVAIPAHSILFTTDVAESAAETVPADALMNLREVAEREKSFDRNAYELLLQRAAEQLKGAKSLHDAAGRSPP